MDINQKVKDKIEQISEDSFFSGCTITLDTAAELVEIERDEFKYSYRLGEFLDVPDRVLKATVARVIQDVQEHKTEPAIAGEVDSKIKPLVDWFNSFQDTYTLHSCEGYHNKTDVCEPVNSPYVHFVCREEIELHFFLAKLQKHGSFNIILMNGVISYIFTLHNKKQLEDDELKYWLPANPFKHMECC